MPFRLQCNGCGAKSQAVEALPPSAWESQMLAEFRGGHAACAAGLSRDVPLPQCGPFGSAKPPPQAVRRPHGHFERTGPYGELEEGETLSCCHCGCHWEVRVGSGRTRGFCARCVGYTCGNPRCLECVPKEARLENVEAGRPELTPPPAKVLVPQLFDLEVARATAGDELPGAPAGGP